MHEKGLQRQIGVGTLVNSQQRRALAVPVINRLPTADKPRVNRGFCSSTGLHRISFVRACEETFRTVVYSALEGQRGGWLPRPPKCRHLVLPSVAPPRRPPCAVPTRPARCVSGFWTRQVDSTGKNADSVTRGVRSERVLEVRVVARHAQGQVL